MDIKFLLNHKTFRFVLLFLILLGGFALIKFLNIDIEHFHKQLSGYPILISGIIFIFLYVVITFFVWFGTIDIFRLAASLLFGAYWGTLFVWIAELINAYSLFHLSRKLGQEYIQERFKLNKKRIEEAKKSSSLLGIFALRLNPLVPFRVMDLAFGLTRVEFKTYFMGIVISSLIRIFWLQLILVGVGTNALKDIPAVMEYFQQNPWIVSFSGIYFLCVIILSIIALILRRK
jgi:uncharacterized membrane protein YdjX (TVP38/TMEM64 family)